MMRLDPDPVKRIRDWFEDDEDADQGGDGRAEDENADSAEGESEDDEETRSEYVQRIVREYSQLGARTRESDRKE